MPPRLSYIQLKERVSSVGYRLQSTEDEYIQAGVNKLMILCNGCDEPHRVQLCDLEKIPAGTKRCIKCGVKKRAEARAKNSGVYQNIQKYFTPMNYTLLNSEEEIQEGMKAKKDDRSIKLMIKFKCNQDHVNELEYASFNNKKIALKNGTVQSFCVECCLAGINVIIRQKRLDELEKIFKSFNHKIIELEPDNLGVKFVCGFCQNYVHNEYYNIVKSSYTGRCLKCFNVVNRKDYQELLTEIESMGFSLLTNESDYTDNKNISVGCNECINCIWENISIHDVKRRLIRHFHCRDCMVGCQGAENRFSPYCQRCYGVHNPDEEIPRRFKMKEKYFVDCVNKFLNETNINVEYNVISFDKSLQACSKRRPDVFIDCFTHCIIGELDENKHAGYSCENKRMCEIWQDIAHRPVVFIRLNPDAYLDDNNTRIPSCFSYTEKGEMLVRQVDWDNRFKKFTTFLHYYLLNIPNKAMTIEYVCYDSEDARNLESSILTDWTGGKFSGNRHKILLNRYRKRNDENGIFIEVEISNGYTFTCDLDMLPLVESRVWSKQTKKDRNGTKRFYVKCRKTETQAEETFHKVAYPDFKGYTFLDKNALNLRRINVINK